MSDYLKKPSIRRNVNVVKGDRLRDGQNVELHLTQSLASNAEVPEKTADLLRVEVPEEKVIAVKEKKKEQASRAGLQRPPASAANKSAPSAKRSGEEVPSRVQKRSKTTDSPVIDLDSSEVVPNPTPIRSIPPQDQSSTGEAGSIGPKGSAGDGKLKGAAVGRSRETDDEDVDIKGDSSDEAFIPEWSVKRGTRMNNSSVCRDMMIHLATPGEEKYIDAHDDEEATNRAWLLLAKSATAQADLLFHFENASEDRRKVVAAHKDCDRKAKDGLKRFQSVKGDLEKLRAEHAKCASEEPEELKKLKAEHAGCSSREQGLSGRIADLEKEKEEWRKVSGDQVERIKSLEADLAKTRLLLSDEEMTIQELRKKKEEIAILAGNAEIDRNKIVNIFIPEMVRRLLGSHEYKTTLAEPFNLYSQSGFLDGVSLGRKPEQVEKLLEGVEGLDLYADAKYQPLYDQLFVKEYPYVQKIRKTIYRTFDELMELHPDPAPAIHVEETVEETVAPGPTS